MLNFTADLARIIPCIFVINLNINHRRILSDTVNKVILNVSLIGDIDFEGWGWNSGVGTQIEIVEMSYITFIANCPVHFVYIW